VIRLTSHHLVAVRWKAQALSMPPIRQPWPLLDWNAMRLGARRGSSWLNPGTSVAPILRRVTAQLPAPAYFSAHLRRGECTVILAGHIDQGGEGQGNTKRPHCREARAHTWAHAKNKVESRAGFANGAVSLTDNGQFKPGSKWCAAGGSGRVPIHLMQARVSFPSSRRSVKRARVAHACQIGA
jgi:hypothetical protein